ncbi:hypothetical protein I546_5828 [Mycobacterium kansasii 732]|nr:hypothetical protein I546_5828 [Mycobacterium kansasii 732]
MPDGHRNRTGRAAPRLIAELLNGPTRPASSSGYHLPP